jgi:elongation factor Ts
VNAPFVASYIHGANRIGVLVGLNKQATEAGKDLAMQIAALNPVAVDPQSVSPDIIAREKDIALEQLKNDPKMAGKPVDMLDKIAAGKLNAFYKEQTLLQQSFVKDSSKTVADYLKSVDADLKVTEFKRVALG